MRTNFVLIDSENVKPEYIEKLKHEHFQVIVFVGPHLKRLDFAIDFCNQLFDRLFIHRRAQATVNSLRQSVN